MTRTRVLKGLILLSIAAALTLFAWPSQPLFAGHAGGQFCFCTTYSDGGGSCSGSLQCFRDHPDPEAYARFNAMVHSWSAFEFNARHDSSDFHCRIDEAERAHLANDLVVGLEPRDGFWVLWDNAGVCWQVYVFKHSDAL
jgi:hypothetical protein